MISWIVRITVKRRGVRLFVAMQGCGTIYLPPSQAIGGMQNKSRLGKAEGREKPASSKETIYIIISTRDTE